MSVSRLVAERFELARGLRAVFQPVASLKSGAILGYEGLIRGPAGSAHEMPVALFAQARAADRVAHLEIRCIHVVLTAFCKLKLNGKLFINVGPEMFKVDAFPRERIFATLKKFGLTSQRVVIEITENAQVVNQTAIYAALTEARQMGFEIAIDDLGEGYASLRLWSELQPDYVKIDQHFVRDVHKDPVKFQFVRTIRQLSSAVGTKVIGEGIENPAELRVLRDLGVEFGQGYLLASPAAQPDDVLQPVASRLLAARLSRADLFQEPSRVPKLIDLAMAVPPLDPDDSISTVRERFLEEPDRIGLPVVKDNVPRGVVLRDAVLALSHRREKRSCLAFVDPRALQIDGATPLKEAAMLLAEGDPQRFLMPFIITEQGRYRGLCTAQEVLASLGQQLSASERQPHPLTGLMGIAPLETELARLLSERQSFVAAWLDVRHLEAYNKVFGYARGDNLIRYTALLIAAFCDEHLDLAVHAGGGRFMLILRQTEWLPRVEAMVSEFDRGLAAFISAEDQDQGGFTSTTRDSRTIFHALPALSVGLVKVAADSYPSHNHLLEAMLAANREAKKTPSSKIFIERRGPSDSSRAKLGAPPADLTIGAAATIEASSPPSARSASVSTRSKRVVKLNP
jgi:EAL domain-containing protein (putative c-di-GMP-specific phosphodiesterase class I)/GGDEF domain-containing protein